MKIHLANVQGFTEHPEHTLRAVLSHHGVAGKVWKRMRTQKQVQGSTEQSLLFSTCRVRKGVLREMVSEQVTEG